PLAGAPRPRASPMQSALSRGKNRDFRTLIAFFTYRYIIHLTLEIRLIYLSTFRYITNIRGVRYVREIGWKSGFGHGGISVSNRAPAGWCFPSRPFSRFQIKEHSHEQVTRKNHTGDRRQQRYRAGDGQTLRRRGGRARL